jgi:cyclohexanone monooxygenase
VAPNLQDLLDPAELGFDPEKLRSKYREERDKRLRPDGNEQYQEVVGDFARYVDDPYVEPGYTRAPVIDEVEAAVIGGGFGGLLAAARLREAGIEDLRVIERGGDFGGTWYWNRYPGAMCDIESYIYLPLLEEMKYVPTEKYAHAPEILAYSRRIGEHYRLYEGALLQTEVTSMTWDEAARRWIVRTDRGDRVAARFVAMSNGPLNRPKLPGIPGIRSFAGHTFHTSRWDYGYTGGNSDGNLSKLHDKRVGIIGTGATAVQCVPHLGEAAKHLYVFQRTPSSIDVRDNRSTDLEWAHSLAPGWQQRRMDNFNILVNGGHQDEDMVGDGWTEIFRTLAGVMPKPEAAGFSKQQMALATEMADFRKMEKIRARVDAIVRDPATAEALKPYYRQFCKRPCFHDEYLDTFNRRNVTLVDTEGRGVERVTPRGVVVGGVEYELDCLIFATGFEVGTNYTRRSGYEVIGRGGVKLSEKWAGAATTFHGLHSHGFPNCYFMGFVQSALTPNFPHLLNEQAKHIAYVVAHARERGLTAVEATAEAEAEWVATIRRLARLGERFFRECTPGYYNGEGKPEQRNGLIANSYGGGPIEFFKLLKEWRDTGELRGLELR